MKCNVKNTVKQIRNIDTSQRLDCMLLLMLHRKFGFGKKRLMEFHKDFLDTFHYFENYYMDDGVEIAKIKLREEVGIDIDKLYESEGLM